MFAGIDEIDWASMRHAYGPAEEVPGLLRGLVDADPAVREVCLDGMYGAVHHQGDVYECTLAAVPFLLEALTTPGTAGRDGIAELLASIGAVDEWPVDGEGDMVARTRQARELIAAAAPGLVGLAGDEDQALRAAMPRLLTICPGSRDVLLGRMAVETDAGVRRAVLDGLGRLAVLTGDAGITESLLGAAGTSVAALIAVARVDPFLAPLEGAADLLERAYAEESAPAGPAGFTTDTLIGAIRVRTEEADAGRRAPHAARLIDQLTDALGPRVAERAAILARLLRSPHADVVGDALYGASKLIDRWRGDHAELVRLVADQLASGDERFAEHAARVLSHWTPLTAPVADAVAAALPPDGWAVRYASGPPGLHPTLVTLGRLGDERALPYLLMALEFAERPHDTDYLLARYPQHADRVLAALAPILAAPRAGNGWEFHATLRAFGPAAAPAVPWLLGAPLDGPAATTLGEIGPAAADAVPALRAAAVGDDPDLAVAAAGALWRIERSPDALPLLTAQVKGRAGTAALREIAALGPAGAAAARAVAPALKAKDQYWWRPVHAAVALWRIAGDAERCLPVLAEAWHGNPRTRIEIAAAATGPLAAGLAPLLRAELAEPRRHGVTDDSWSSAAVTDDERFQAACRAALAQL